MIHCAEFGDTRAEGRDSPRVAPLGLADDLATACRCAGVETTVADVNDAWT